MGLLESIEADKAELAKLEDKQEEVQEAATDEEEEGGQDEDAKETKEGAAGEGENKEEPKEVGEKVEEEKPDAAAYYKMRRELRATKAKLAETEGKTVQPVSVKEADKVETVEKEPSKTEDYEAWLEWKLNKQEQVLNRFQKKEEEQAKAQDEAKLYRGAVDEFRTLEREVKQTYKDYDHVAKHLEERLRSSIETLYPQLSEDQVNSAVAKQVLTMASSYAQRGLNAAEELYHLSRERYGYKDSVEKLEDGNKEDKGKPNLKAIDASKRKAKSPLQAGGRSGDAKLTLESVAKMKLGEFSKLTPKDLEELSRAG